MQTTSLINDNEVREDEPVRVLKGRTGYAHRAPWNLEEKKALKRGFEGGVSITELSTKHHRTPNAILVQLCRLKCITHEQRIVLATTLRFDGSIPDANTYLELEGGEIDFNF